MVPVSLTCTLTCNVPSVFDTQAVREHDVLANFDYALWMDSDNHLVADCCEDLLGTLVALRHGWSYTAGAADLHSAPLQSSAAAIIRDCGQIL